MGSKAWFSKLSLPGLIVDRKVFGDGILAAVRSVGNVAGGVSGMRHDINILPQPVRSHFV